MKELKEFKFIILEIQNFLIALEDRGNRIQRKIKEGDYIEYFEKELEENKDIANTFQEQLKLLNDISDMKDENLRMSLWKDISKDFASTIKKFKGSKFFYNDDLLQ